MSLKQLIRSVVGTAKKPGGPILNSPRYLDRFWRESLPEPVAKLAVEVDAHMREGRFQRSLSLIAGASSILAGLEVSYEHYRGSYGQKVMWTPVVLSGAMTGAGIWGFFSTWAARTVLRWTSFLTLLDSLIGFGFHIRGIARKPGGWRLPVTNIVMGAAYFRTASLWRQRLYGTYRLVLAPGRSGAAYYRHLPRKAPGILRATSWPTPRLSLEYRLAGRPVSEAPGCRDHPECVLQRIRGALLALQE